MWKKSNRRLKKGVDLPPKKSSHSRNLQLLLDCWLLRQLLQFHSKPGSEKYRKTAWYGILRTHWSFWALIPSETQSIKCAEFFDSFFSSVSLRVISASVGAFLWLTSNILNFFPLFSTAERSADLQVSTGRFRWRQVLVNSLNAGSVEAKPTWLLLSLVRRVRTEINKNNY